MARKEGRALLEYLLDDACENARYVIEEFPEPTKGVSKRGAIFDEYSRLQAEYRWEVEGEMIPQISMLSPEDFKQYLMVERAILAVQILDTVKEMAANGPDFTKLEPGRLGASMYFIGQWYGQIIEIDTMLDPGIMNKTRSLLHGELVKKSRWARHNKSFQDALEFANELWSTGDTRRHHEMVAFLMEQIEEFRTIEGADDWQSKKRRLLKEIGELAKTKYPKRFFLPGNSKTDNP